MGSDQTLRRPVKINFRDLQPGDGTIIDGVEEIVSDLRYAETSLVSFNGGTARPIEVTFRSGRTISHHPGNWIVVTR